MGDDLVKRLRGKRERCHDLSGVYWTEDMDCQEAADRIEALEAEVLELALQVLASEGQAAENLNRALNAEAEVARLRHILDPTTGLDDPYTLEEVPPGEFHAEIQRRRKVLPYKP